MLLREVEYAKPGSVAEALELLAADEGARALAGGQTLINVMKARAASPDKLVDLNGLEELRGIELAGDGTLTVGAMTTYTELMASAEAKARPILGEVCATIADVQVRNRGTIGGNVCSNDPTNHLPPLMVAVGARMTIASGDGEREVPAEEFFLGVYLTAVGPGELLTRISIPAGKKDGFAAVTLGADGTCICNAAASVNGSVRVALGCVDAVPVLLVTDPRRAGGGGQVMDVRVTVNGTSYERDVEPRKLLIHFLRDDLDLTGSHVGCDTGNCGACSVLLDGVLVKSCMLLAVQADGASIETVEGLGDEGELTPLQQSFNEHHALQCGYCTPGMLMSATALLRENPSPSEDEIRKALQGNICRCTGYWNIVEAVKSVAK
jgi:xanthine dehydrogenase iron-sulfur cluster and FAD-binding subunit A